MPNSILIVDDDSSISEILEFNLKSEGFEVTCASSAEEALAILESTSFGLILLDVMMGGMSGYKMAERLRSSGDHTPLIFVTAKDTENDLLTGFSVGGDDYITKPFSVKEVIARVKAVIKRKALSTATPREEVSHRFVYEDMEIEIEKKEVLIDGTNIALTKTEMEILILLAKHPERIFSREEILDKVWQETAYVTDRTVDVHITRLRKKLGKYGAYITNRTGYGYRFAPLHYEA